MKAYTVSEVAKMAGVSVRTLHHYDEIGLLSPAARTDAGYRLYEEQDLLRLQQILFFKELDFSLSAIQDILDDPGFDLVRALTRHRHEIERRAARLTQLLTTIDKTLHRLTEDDEMTMTDEELYAGFTREQAERYQREAAEMYDPQVVAETNKRLRKLTKAQWQAVKDEGKAIAEGMAALLDRDPGDPEVQAFVARHHAWIERFYAAPAEVYTGLAQLYTEHPEFRASYDAVAPGLADFLAAAMRVYAERNL